MSAFESFVAMRGDLRRTWIRMSDLQDATQRIGRRWTAYEVRLAIAGLPKPERKWHGHWHYTQEHMAAVEAAARMENGVMEGIA